MGGGTGTGGYDDMFAESEAIFERLRAEMPEPIVDEPVKPPFTANPNVETDFGNL